MKTTAMATGAYESPDCSVIEFDAQKLICLSPTGGSNESYEDGDTSDWYNNI